MRYVKDTSFTKLLVFITAAIKDDLNSEILDVLPKAGSETFSSPLSNNEGRTITHYWCYWRLEDPDKTILTDYLDENYPDDSSWYSVLPDQVASKLLAEGLKRFDLED